MTKNHQVFFRARFSFENQLLNTGKVVFLDIVKNKTFPLSHEIERVYILKWADDIRTKHAFVWGDLNARNQPNAFSYGET